MTDGSNTSETMHLVSTLAKTKEEKLNQYQLEMLQLKKEKQQNAKDSVKKYKYILAKMRYNQLKRTTQELWQLEQKMERLNNYSDKFASEFVKI